MVKLNLIRGITLTKPPLGQRWFTRILDGIGLSCRSVQFVSGRIIRKPSRTSFVAECLNSDQVSTASKSKLPFCRQCGKQLVLGVPEGDDRERALCSGCGYVDYMNPKMVVGCIVEHNKKILLCRRGIEPCKGMWTVPAGYLEMRESTQDGAVRETLEESNARVEVVAPYSFMDIPIIGQTYILFRAKLLPPYTFSPGHETLETRLFDVDELPFNQIAFSSISVALKQYVEDMKSGVYRLHYSEIVKTPGSSPNDPKSYNVIDHFSTSTES